MEDSWPEALLAAITQGVVVLDARGCITYFSPGAERITGLKQADVMGQHCDVACGALTPHEPLLGQIPPAGGRRKISIQLADGCQRVLLVTTSEIALQEEALASTVVVLCDVTEEETVHRLLGHFISNVSHEVRTPLSALGASVELLLDQLPDLSEAELSELLSSLRLGVWRLQTLVDNLLEAASLEAGHFRVFARPANVREIVAEAVFTMRALLERHDQRLVLQVPEALPRVRADFRRTVQVLVNLLGNACEYGPDGGTITVTVSVPEDAWVRVAVSDEGPGIAPEVQAGLFCQFRGRERAGEVSPTGAGLGLTVVKAIVEAQGGRVGLGDAADGGTEVWFTLPTVAGQVQPGGGRESASRRR